MMAIEPSDGDEFTSKKSTDKNTDDWTVHVDIFDVDLSFRVSDGNARLVSSTCECDIQRDTCRHIAISEGRVRAVFAGETLSGVKGTITHAPALWRPIVTEKEEVKSSDTAVQA